MAKARQGLTAAAAALLGGLLLGALTAASPSPTPVATPPAQSSDDPSVVAFTTTGPVGLAVDDDGAYFVPGTVYFTVNLAFPGGLLDYAATWERAGTAWPSTDAVLDAANAYWAAAADSYASGCRATAVRQAFAQYTTLAAFQVSPYWTAQREAYDTSWLTTAALEASVATACQTPATDWTWAGDSSDWVASTSVLSVRIPYTEYGPGEHRLELAVSTVPDTGPQYPADWLTNPACIVSAWTDGPPATVPCGGYTVPAYTVRAATTVDVPDLAAGGIVTIPPSATPAPALEAALGAAVFGLPVWLYAGIGAVVVLALVALAILLVARRRSDSDEPEPPKHPPARHGHR